MYIARKTSSIHSCIKRRDNQGLLLIASQGLSSPFDDVYICGFCGDDGWEVLAYGTAKEL